MLYKNLPDSELRKVMRMRMLLDWLAAFQMLVLGRSLGDFKAVIKARKAFKAWKHDFIRDRETIQRTAKVDVVPERIGISILWQYYVKGKKTYRLLVDK